jgi:hypothetical protein
MPEKVTGLVSADVIRQFNITKNAGKISYDFAARVLRGA